MHRVNQSTNSSYSEDFMDRFVDLIEEDDLENQYVPNKRKEQKRLTVAKDSKKNRWRIKD